MVGLGVGEQRQRTSKSWAQTQAQTLRLTCRDTPHIHHATNGDEGDGNQRRRRTATADDTQMVGAHTQTPACSLRLECETRAAEHSAELYAYVSGVASMGDNAQRDARLHGRE